MSRSRSVSRSSLRARLGGSLLTVCLVLSATRALAVECARLQQLAPSGCRARLAMPGAAGGVEVTDPAGCALSAGDCNNDGRPDLEIPNSGAAAPVTFRFDDVCDGAGASRVRIQYSCFVNVSAWTARDAAGNELDTKTVLSTGLPQWVGLDGQGECIASVEVVAQELCVHRVCWECCKDASGEPGEPGEPNGGDPDVGGAPTVEGFVRGDANGDTAVFADDAILLLRWMLLGDGAPACLDAGDADDNGMHGLEDALYLIDFSLRGGAAPPAPFPGCGHDPTEDSLPCERFTGCATR
jgi:hypothetical protein